jgi:hypothetical protein
MEHARIFKTDFMASCFVLTEVNPPLPGGQSESKVQINQVLASDWQNH